jgi:hypothetical protein
MRAMMLRKFLLGAGVALLMTGGVGRRQFQRLHPRQ